MHRVDHQDMAAATKAMAAAVEAMAAVVAGLVVAEVLVDTADAAATPEGESLYHSDSWIRLILMLTRSVHGRSIQNTNRFIIQLLCGCCFSCRWCTCGTLHPIPAATTTTATVMHPATVAVAVAVDTILPHGVLLPAAASGSTGSGVLGVVTGNKVNSMAPVCTSYAFCACTR